MLSDEKDFRNWANSSRIQRPWLWSRRSSTNLAAELESGKRSTPPPRALPILLDAKLLPEPDSAMQIVQTSGRHSSPTTEMTTPLWSSRAET
jgi:hypothetical protein